ncbi:MAG: hypothetical protein ABEJ46_03385, partial [Gemmatimonadota bacterium]
SRAQPFTMKCHRCHSFGDIDPSYFERQAEEVMAKLEGEEDIAFSIVALDEETQCEEAFEEIPVKDREEFIETCENAETSVIFSSGGQEFLFEEPEALQGLLAHEMMHTVQRDEELGEQIEEGAKAYEDEMITALRESEMSDQEINRFIHTVFQTAIYTLKDLFTNTELVRQGFAEELEAYYHHMLGIDSFCPAPDFYGEEAELEEVQDAITFELGLLPAWLPFKGLERDGSNEIRNRIEECYEKGIPQVAAYIHELEDLYRDTFDEPEAFIDAYFRQVVERSIEMMGRAEE